MSSKSTTFVVPSMSTKRYAPKPLPVKKTRTTRLPAAPPACLPECLPSIPKFEPKPLILVQRLRSGQLKLPSRPLVSSGESKNVNNISNRFRAIAKPARISLRKEAVPKQAQNVADVRQVATVSAVPVQSACSRIPRISRGALTGISGRTNITVRQVTPVPGSRIPLPVRRGSATCRNIDDDRSVVRQILRGSGEQGQVANQHSKRTTPGVSVSTTGHLVPTHDVLRREGLRSISKATSSDIPTPPMPKHSICTTAFVPTSVERIINLPPQRSNTLSDTCPCPLVSQFERSPASTISSPTTSIFSSKGPSSLSDFSTTTSVSLGNISPPRAVPESPIASLAKVLFNSERIRKLYIPPLADDARASRNPMTQMEIDTLRAQKKVAGGRAASVPGVERLGSLSGIAIVSKVRAQWEARK